MSTVPSATAPSAPSFLWNNKNYLLLAGLGIVLLIVFRHFNSKTSTANRLPSADLSQRLVTTFPYSANVNPMFPSEVPGIIRINLENLGLSKSRNPLEFIFIQYAYQGKYFFLPMTVKGNEAEIYLRHLPYGEKVYLQFQYKKEYVAGLYLNVDQKFGIYQIYIEGGDWKAVALPETPLQAVKKLDSDLDADTTLSLSIKSKLKIVDSKYITQEHHYRFKNTTQKIHVLFFEIAGLTAAADPKDLRLVVPITVLPGTITLPQGFLRTCWEQTFRSTHGREPPHDPQLTIVAILDTAAPDPS
jgi:hypothetical protein